MKNSFMNPCSLSRKKWFLFLLLTILLLNLCSCQPAVSPDANASKTLGGIPDSASVQDSNGTKSSDETQAPNEDTASPDEKRDSSDSLQLLTNDLYSSCAAKDGFYYLSEDSMELKDGKWGKQLMYMDFASRQEIYLCSDASCSHDHEQCNAVFTNDAFPNGSNKLFVWNQKLYLLNKDYDNDGAVEVNYIPEESSAQNFVEPLTNPAALYEMNLDGTNRKKIYTFEDGILPEDFILSDSSHLYFVTKKLETRVDAATSVTTASYRHLVSLDPKTKTLKTLTSLNTEDSISWKILGSYDHSLILQGISYPDGKGAAPELSDSEWKKRYQNSKTVFSVLDLNQLDQTIAAAGTMSSLSDTTATVTNAISSATNTTASASNAISSAGTATASAANTASMEFLYEIPNTEIHSFVSQDGMLYISTEASNEILAIDLRTKQQSTLASLKQCNLIGITSDQLICQTWDLSSDPTLYFVNRKTGAVSHCDLTNQCNGWALEFICETADDALVIYNYDAIANPDDSYEINQYQYALISKKDLYAGKNRFRPIQMVGKGR